MTDNRTWVWVSRYDPATGGCAFDEFVCYATMECMQVWDDGHVEIFDLA